MSGKAAAAGDRAALLAALHRHLRRMSSQSVLFSHAVAERLGMHPTDLECLGFLADEGPVPALRLAELTGLTSGAVTRMIDRLERAGYVRREPDPRDRRRVIVRPVIERLSEIVPLFENLSRAMDELCTHYSDHELALILDFTTRSGAVVQEQTARLRTAEPLDDARQPPVQPSRHGLPPEQPAHRVTQNLFQEVDADRERARLTAGNTRGQAAR